MCYVIAIQQTLEVAISDNELLDVVGDVRDLVEALHHIRLRWVDIEAGISPLRHSLSAEMLRPGMRGRPKYFLDKEQLEFLRELRFTWTQIATMFGVCRRTLYNIRDEIGLVDYLEDFTDICSKVFH